MQYNQPYDQPSNPNAPYIDGNPAAGIQGSIVPAHALEYDQREIVAVIDWAYAHGYRDFNGDLCQQSSNSDLTQLLKALQGFLGTTPSWYIDTPVVFTLHGTSPNFPDLNAAMEYLSKYIITHNGSVTLLIAAGQWHYTQGVVLDHPNADRIVITGSAMPSTPVGGDFAVTGFSIAARQTDRTNTYNKLRPQFAGGGNTGTQTSGRYSTELYFTAGGGISNYSNGITIQNLLISGDRNGGGTIAQEVGLLLTNNISVCNSYGSGFAIAGGAIFMQNGSILSASGCAGHGIAVAMGGNHWHGSGTNIWVTSNDANGISAGFNCGSNGYATCVAAGNGGAGLMCSVMGQYQLGSQCQFYYNAVGGVFIDMGNFYADNTNGGSWFYNNGAAGLAATVGSVAQAPGGTFYGNTGNQLSAFAGSVVWCNGSTVTGSTSPPNNTLSPDGSYLTYS